MGLYMGISPTAWIGPTTDAIAAAVQSAPRLDTRHTYTLPTDRLARMFAESLRRALPHFAVSEDVIQNRHVTKLASPDGLVSVAVCGPEIF